MHLGGHALVLWCVLELVQRDSWKRTEVARGGSEGVPSALKVSTTGFSYFVRSFNKNSLSPNCVPYPDIYDLKCLGMYLGLVLGKLRQQHCHELQANLGYIVNYRSARATE